MLQAAADGADVVVHTAVRGRPGFSSDLLATVAGRVSESGSVVLAAAGDDGQHGLFYVEAPGVGTDVISVGSFDSPGHAAGVLKAAGGLAFT
ncbi:hypothetical protein HK405_010621, partial [Cladochytrium tenue]